MGVKGGFEVDDLKPSDHTFNNTKKYNPAMAQNDYVEMAENVRKSA